MLTGRDEELPLVLLDDDVPGRKHLTELKTSLYESEPGKLLSVSEFVDFEGAEVEDLIPSKFLASVLDRIIKEADRPFEDVVTSGEPVVRQIEKWASDQRVTLPPHWKVELAKRCKQRMLDVGLGHFEDAANKWTELFKRFIGPAKKGGS